MADQHENNQNPNNPINFLTTLLGSDPRKPMQLSDSLMKEVVEEVQKGRIDAAKARAKEILVKAISLVEEKQKKDKEFAGLSKKFDKEMGKIMGQLRSIIDGKPYQDPDAPKDAD